MADFNCQRDHSRAFYAPRDMGNVKRGMLFWCHAKEDETRAKELGYTSDKYIPSEWPKTMWHKDTGESKPVGRLEWSDEQNAVAVKKMGPDWGFEHVDVPEPTKPGPAPQADIAALASIMADQK